MIYLTSLNIVSNLLVFNINSSIVLFASASNLFKLYSYFHTMLFIFIPDITVQNSLGLFPSISVIINFRPTIRLRNIVTSI